MKRQQFGKTPTGPGEYREGFAQLARPIEAATLIIVRTGEDKFIGHETVADWILSTSGCKYRAS